MNKAWASTVVCWVAGLVFCVGLCFSVMSLLRSASLSQQLEKTIRNVERLDALDQESKVLYATVEQFDALRYDQLVDARTLANSAFGAERVDTVRQDLEACGDGYWVNRIEMYIKDISLELLLPFVHMSESQRPPLRLSACTIHASAARSGYGDVTLKLERIERSSE
jgi:hypothetical protein